MQCKKVVGANFKLAKWAGTAQVPSFEEYVEVGEVENAAYLTMIGALMGMEQVDTEEACNWTKIRAKFVKDYFM